MRSAKEYKAIREEIYRFIGAYITKHVYAPSNKEIAEAVHRMAWIRQTSWGITSQSILESSLRPVIPLRSISNYCRTDWTMERITWTR